MNTKLTPPMKAEIIRQVTTGSRTQCEIAKTFNVSPQTVTRVLIERNKRNTTTNTQTT